MSVTRKPHSKFAVQFPAGFARLVGPVRMEVSHPNLPLRPAFRNSENAGKSLWIQPQRCTVAGRVAVISDRRDTSVCPDVVPSGCIRVGSLTRADEVIE
jgi:hypothetical protein